MEVILLGTIYIQWYDLKVYAWLSVPVSNIDQFTFYQFIYMDMKQIHKNESKCLVHTFLTVQFHIYSNICFLYFGDL